MTAILSAQRLLLRREHSVFELREKLTAKGYAAEDITEAILSMVAANYLSDSRFAEHYTRYRASAGFGPVRIRGELRERGVCEDDIEAGLALYEGDFVENARRVLHKKFGENPPQSFKEKAKQMQFLQYRGFLQNEIKQVIEHEEC